MKKALLITGIAAIVAVISFSFTSSALVEAKTKKADIVWTGKKVGGQHTGNINFKSSSLKFDNNKLVGGSFVVDMNSMTCTDLEGEYNQKLIGHLKSDDFFSVEKYGTAKYIITNVEDLGNNSYKVLGDMTIKGKTNPVSFETKVAQKGNIATATAKVIIDRSKYDVKYGSSSFFDGLGDKVIYDDFELDITIKASL